MPSIAALLRQYRDRTGASYEDMEAIVGKAVSRGRFQQIVEQPQKGFPGTKTIRALAELLHVSVTTILEAWAVTLGLDVEQRRPLLAITLPPGTDSLTDRDRAAILAVIRQLVDARRPTPSGPDLSRAEGLRLSPEENNNHDTRANR